MNAALPLLAALDENDQLLLKNSFRSGNSQMLIIFGALIAVGILSFVFVFVFRRRFLRKRSRHHHQHQETQTSAASEQTRPKRRKWRRLRREHRPVNPTLAQTHGLPPVRDPNQSPPGL